MKLHIKRTYDACSFAAIFSRTRRVFRSPVRFTSTIFRAALPKRRQSVLSSFNNIFGCFLDSFRSFSGRRDFFFGLRIYFGTGEAGRCLARSQSGQGDFCDEFCRSRDLSVPGKFTIKRSISPVESRVLILSGNVSPERSRTYCGSLFRSDRNFNIVKVVCVYRKIWSYYNLL